MASENREHPFFERRVLGRVRAEVRAVVGL